MTEIIILTFFFMIYFLKVSDRSTIYPLSLQVIYLILFTLWCCEQLFNWIFWNCSSVKKFVCIYVAVHVFIFILRSYITVYLIFLLEIIWIIAFLIFILVLLSYECVWIILLFRIMTLCVFLIKFNTMFFTFFLIFLVSFFRFLLIIGFFQKSSVNFLKYIKFKLI